ncbi:MAG TPA: alpha/beta hydrolase, partial [Dongiaceae bacterium]|nr:alpha/beta hydrolase [Dongiaceae bacterium]
MAAPVLIITGLGGSGPEHWQSLWQARLPDARRVEQADWDKP